MEMSEDRVFGISRTYPAPPLSARAPGGMDLCSASVEGAEVVYASQGTGAHPALVFVHGWGSSHKFWKHALSAFSPRYWCVAPDLVGFGISEKPRRDYSVEAYAVWLGKFLDALGRREVTLVGHSMGGAISLLFALEHPERVTRLAVVNPLIQGSTAFSFRTRLLTLPGVRGLIYALGHVRPIRRWIAKDFSYVARLDDEIVDDVVRGTFQSTTESLNSLARTDLVPRLGALSVPTLAIGTDEDRIILGRQHELIPTAEKVLIPHTGHIPMLERPEEFNRVLDEFLRRE